MLSLWFQNQNWIRIKKFEICPNFDPDPSIYTLVQCQLWNGVPATLFLCLPATGNGPLPVLARFPDGVSPIQDLKDIAVLAVVPAQDHAIQRDSESLNPEI